MSSQDHTRKLITIRRRRLEKLKEQQALKGINAEPELLIEIEDIEAEIVELQKELEDIPQPESPPPDEALPKIEFVPPKRKPALRDFWRWLQGE